MRNVALLEENGWQMKDKLETTIHLINLTCSNDIYNIDLSLNMINI